MNIHSNYPQSAQLSFKRMVSRNNDVNPAVHFISGATGGAVGAIITCPLDVVKTRLQSSCASWGVPSRSQLAVLQANKLCTKTKTLPLSLEHSRLNTFAIHNFSTGASSVTVRLSLTQCLGHIYRTEGVAGLWRGLGPNLTGVAPSRAIYFCAYAKSKEFYSTVPQLSFSSSLVHLCSAGTAGFIGCTATNPIWFIKTRLQLDEARGAKKLTVFRCIQNVYAKHGIKGFYRGITASYMGISETALNFVIYEKLKECLILQASSACMENDRSPLNFAEYFVSGAISKTIACVTFYPHEVARTRMREEGNMYRGFWQTLSKVVVDEGYVGLYRGLYTQLVRAIPNTAIMMGTYELAVYLLTPHKPNNTDYADGC